MCSLGFASGFPNPALAVQHKDRRQPGFVRARVSSLVYFLTFCYHFSQSLEALPWQCSTHQDRRCAHAALQQAGDLDVAAGHGAVTAAAAALCLQRPQPRAHLHKRLECFALQAPERADVAPVGLRAVRSGGLPGGTGRRAQTAVRVHHRSSKDRFKHTGECSFLSPKDQRPGSLLLQLQNWRDHHPPHVHSGRPSS